MKLQTFKLQRLDPNEMCAPSLPTSGGFWWCLHWCCFGEASKVVNPISLDYDTYFSKIIQFFSCVHTWKPPKGFLSRVLKPPSQYQKAKNGLLPSKSSKTIKEQNHHCKISLVQELPTINFCLEPSHFDQGAKFWLIFYWIHPKT